MRHLEGWLCFLTTLLIASCPCSAILLLNLRIPSYVRKGDDVAIVCVYDLEYGGLYSLKWYKDDQEFYSFVPRLKGNPKRFFPLPGVDIDSNKTDDRQLFLRNVSLSTEGDYKCQVSGEGPSFTTVSQTKELRVAVVPAGPPVIGPLPARFEPGDWLHLNCTSGESRPPTRLSWFVNGREAEDQQLRHFPLPPARPTSSETPLSSLGRRRPLLRLRPSVLGLQFWVRGSDDHFEDGKLRVKCRAVIPGIYYMETETATVGEFTLPHKVLQARAAAAAPPAPPMAVPTTPRVGGQRIRRLYELVHTALALSFIHFFVL